MRIAAVLACAWCVLAAADVDAKVDTIGNEQVHITASDVPLLGTQAAPSTVSPQSGSLVDASTAILGTTSVQALAACGGAAPTGCINGAGRSYLVIVNQNTLTGATGNLCWRLGGPASCVPGTGSCAALLQAE